MYFDAAESKIANLETRLAALEAAPAVDVSSLQAQITELDARLDAIAAAAADPS
jgi:BMFP domain-containing protein YqiC